MRRLTTSYGLLGLSIVAMTVALAVPVLLYMRINQARSYIAQVDSELTEASVREAQSRAARQMALESQHDRDALAQLAVAEGGAADFITEVEGAARAARITLSIGSVDVVPNQGVFDALTLSAQGSGTFSALEKFVTLLETLPTLTVLDSVSYEAQESGGWRVTIGFHAPIHKKL
jgi:hypothetical protein